jgi:DNA-directed RNA polymerase specialized sigma24 family protein
MRQMPRRKSRSGQIAKLASSSGNAATWRQIAWEALEGKKLGYTLRSAVQALSVECREVLFLQDVKNLSTAETAWVLDITMGAVRSRLLRARMKVRNASVGSLAETQ